MGARGARHARRGRPGGGGGCAKPGALQPLAHMGLAGLLAGPAGRVRPTGSAQSSRIGFLFFPNLFFM
jgi:hypothetical protein